MNRIFLCIILLVSLFGCKPSYELCRSRYPCPDPVHSVIVDSTYVVDSAVRVAGSDADFQYALAKLSDSLHYVYEDSLLRLGVRISARDSTGRPSSIEWRTVVKNRIVNVRAANAPKFMETLSRMGATQDSLLKENDRLKGHLTDCETSLQKVKAKRPTLFASIVRELAAIAFGIVVGLIGGFLLSRHLDK